MPPAATEGDDRLIEELELGVRSYNCLKRAGIQTVGDLISKSEGELAASSEPISVGAVQGIGIGVGTKFRVLTRGGLWASAHER